MCGASSCMGRSSQLASHLFIYKCTSEVSIAKNYYLVYLLAHSRPRINLGPVRFGPVDGNVLDCNPNHVPYRLAANIKRGRLDGYKDNIDVKSWEPRIGIEWGN